MSKGDYPRVIENVIKKDRVHIACFIASLVAERMSHSKHVKCYIGRTSNVCNIQCRLVSTYSAEARSKNSLWCDSI